MIQSKKIKNLIISFVILITLFLGVSINIDNNSYHITSEQVMYKVKDLDEAMLLAEEYHLSFNKLYAHGMALFDLTNQANPENLLSLGFEYNNISQATAPITTEATDEDPRIDDQYALEMMNTFEAWQITEGSQEVTVAILDSGIDISHDEFIGRISPLSYNAITQTIGIESVDDETGHGTMVAGIIAANKHNGIGIAGIAPNVKLMIIKINNYNDNNYSDSSIIEGIYYAVDNGADIINLSLAGSNKNAFTQSALEYAKDKGVIVVAAAGNDSTYEPYYPAAYDSTIAVSAVNEYEGRAPYSNYGDYIDISAPGTRIVTTNNYNGYTTVSGTSFAAPQVAGVLALMLSYFPDMEYDEIIERLYLSSIDKGIEGIDNTYGHGIVNAYNALTYNVYKLTFISYGGTEINPIYMLENSKLSAPIPPVLNQYEFLGWYKDVELTVPWDFDLDVITEDTTLHAKYDKTSHMVKLISNFVEIDSFVVDDGDNIDLTNVSLQGHNFLGWTLDSENQIPYDISSVHNDLKLYAHFEPIEYYDIHLYVDGDLNEITSVESGMSYAPDSIEKVGHSFDGWYTDESFSISYNSSQPIQSEMNLYARFIPNILTLTLMNGEEVYESIDVNYHQVVDLPQPSIENSHFVGWYFNDTYEERYNHSPISEDLTLYARFTTEANQVTYIEADNTYTKWYVKNELFEPYTPTKPGYIFLGWYYDQAYTNAYEPISLDENITLYAKYETEYYTVTFYEADQETVLYETEVTYGETVTTPSDPEIYITSSFIYTFSHWSQNHNNVTHDLDIYPIYEKAYIPGSISIKPGLDTLKEGNDWVDYGLTDIESYLTIITVENIDTSQPGKYPVNYLIYDGKHLIANILRIVTVTETIPNVTIELNEGVSSILVGGRYTEAGARSSQGQITIISDVDTTQAGTYKVIYQVTIDNVVFEKTRCVHVFENSLSRLNPVYWYKEERDAYEA